MARGTNPSGISELSILHDELGTHTELNGLAFVDSSGHEVGRSVKDFIT